MNSNKEIKVMISGPGEEPYTTMLEDSLKHRRALVGGEIGCISLSHETVLYCNVGDKRMDLPVNRQFGNDTIRGTFFLYGDIPEGRGLSLTESQIAYFRHYFTGPQPSATTFEVQPVKDMEGFLRLMFGGRKGSGSE